MAKIYRKRGNKLNEVVTFDSACTRQENQPLVYDATDGSVHTTTHIGCLDADDVSINNLTVTGQAIIQEQVTDTIGSNTLVLRSNADAGLAGSENSGIIIHNYNGSADLYAVTDNTGTFRVGTAVSTTTTYPYLRYNEVDNKWYSTAPDVTPTVEVTPVGSPTSWDSVVTSGDDVEYKNIVFSVIDRTSLEPLTTRDESSDMEESYLTKWDSTDEKIITTGTSCTHDLCANGDITSTNDITADGNVCVKTNITVDRNSCLKGNSTIDGNSCVKGTSTVSGEIHSCDCITAPTACISDDLYVAGDINNCNEDSIFHGSYGCFEKNICIKGDLSVDGFATISGLMSDYVATTEDTTTNDWEYLTFVPTNHLTKGRNPVYTDGDLKYNPYSNTLYMGNACVTDTACITCACVGNECVNNLCVGTIVTNANATKSATYCVTNVTGNTDFAIPLYNKNITNVNSTKKAELSYVNQSNGPRYNPNTYTFCVCCARAGDLTAEGGVFTSCIASSQQADLAAGASKNLTIYARCKNSSGTVCNYITTFCGTDGKIYNNYGVCSTGQLNGLNTPVTSDFYSGSTNTGYMYLGYVEGESTANHDVSVSGIIYTYDASNNHFSIKEKTNFTAILRGNAGANTIYEAYTDNYSTRLKFTREVKGNKFILRLYYQLASAYNRIIVRIDEVGIGDMGPQVPPASYWKPSGTIVTSMTGTQFYWNLFPNSGTAKANMAYCLCNVGTTNGYAELYYGSLRGVSSICGNIYFCDSNGSENYCTIYSLATLAHKCQGLGAYNMGSWLYHQESSSPVGIFNPNMDPNESNFLPDIKSIKDTVTDNVNHYCRVIGYSLAAYEGTGDVYCGPYFALYRPCSYTNSNWCNCIRAVMNWRNCVCRNCTTQAGTWLCDSMIELIDSQGGQTIDGTLTVKSLSSAPTILRHKPSSTSPVWFKIGCISPTSSLSTQHLDLFVGGSGIIDTISLDLVDAVANKPIWKISHPYGYASTTGFTCLCVTGETDSWIKPLTLWAQVTPYRANEYFEVYVYNRNITKAWHPGLQQVSSPTGPSIFSSALCINSTEISGCYKADYIYACRFTESNPVGCTSSVTGKSGSILQSGVLDLYSGTPAIDFHHNNASADYSHRIIGLAGGLRIGVTDATGSSAVTKAANYDFKCDGSAVFSNTLCIGASTGSTIYNYTNGTSLYLGTTSVGMGKVAWQGYDCCNVVIGYCAVACCKDTVAIGRCVCSSSSNAVTIGAISSASLSGVAIGAITNASDYGIAIGYNASANAASAIRIGASTSATTAGTCSVGIGQDAKAGGADSIAIGRDAKASEGYAMAIGCGARAACGGAAMGVWANAASAGVALGTQAYTDQKSIAAGHYACAIAQHAIAIGTCAKANIVCSIAIGENANTNVYGAAGTGACILVDERVGGIRRSIICWNVTTKQCDLFNAIYCRFNFNLYANCNTVYVSVTGVYDADTLNEIKWDKNETNPMNFDLGRQGFTNAFTVYENCTCTIPKAGYVQIVGYAR